MREVLKERVYRKCEKKCCRNQTTRTGEGTYERGSVSWIHTQFGENRYAFQTNNDKIIHISNGLTN